MGNVIECLKKRGLIDAMTGEDIAKEFDKPLKIYAGFDPTADSLHVGSLLGIVFLRWFQKFGHTPVVILGGATGRIGDPSGKSKERPLLDQAAIEKNVIGIRSHFESILDFSNPNTKPIILNNDEWWSNYNLIDFLRDVGKHFRVGVMLSKESVKSRLESEEGISFTEFSYQLLQGYDFYHLKSRYGVDVQAGGSDQWGNIVAGIDLTRKMSGESVLGVTWPLLTRSDGKKFGKTEGGAIWLSSERTSVYEFYQYFIRVADADVIQMMRMLTFMDLEEIEAYEEKMRSPDYEPNIAQKKLAEELTRLVHGEAGLETALRVTQSAAPGSKAVLDAATLKEISQDMPNTALNFDEVMGQKFTDIAARIGLCSSKAEALRLIQNAGAYLNNEKIEDAQFRLEEKLLIGGEYLLFGSGKKKKILLKVKK